MIDMELFDESRNFSTGEVYQLKYMLMSFARKLKICLFIPLLLVLIKVELSGQVSLGQLQSVNPNWSVSKFDLIKETDATVYSGHLIKMHLASVEQILRAKTKEQLSSLQQKRRLENLDVLHEYWNRGRFPINTFHQKSMPYFVDIFGTHCAVGYLLAATGEQDLIKEIQSNHNYATINELAVEYPKILDWASENGFSEEELAWIQPIYGVSYIQEMHLIGNGGGVEGDVHVMEVAPDESILYFAGHFTEVDGVAANSIIGWDGENWMTLGDGVEGAIYDIHFHNDQLHISGNFKLYGEDNYSNIAYWNEEEWISLQSGYTGNIYSMETYQGQLYIGGAFQYLNNQELSYLAYYDESESSWSNNGLVLENGALTSLPNVLSVNDTVRILRAFEGKLFIGGDFTLTAANAEYENIIQYEVDHLARWWGNSWLPPTNDVALGPVHELEHIENGLLIIGGFVQGTAVFKKYRDGELRDTIIPWVWTFNEEKPALVHGYVQLDDRNFFYGNLRGTNQVNSVGIYHYGGFHSGVFDEQITAAAVFQEHIYMAGDFTEAFDVALPGLCYSKWDVGLVSTIEKSDQEKLKYYTAEGHLFISASAKIDYRILNIYSVDGRLVKTITLDQFANSITVSLEDLDTQVYAFQFIGDHGQFSDLLPVNF
jgi:hypothetical protein